MAAVNNSMAITISSSEDALIAMPEETELDITKEIKTVKTLIDKEPDIVLNTDVLESSEAGLLLAKESSYEVQIETFTNINYNNGNDFYIRNNMNDTIDIDIYLSDRSINVKPKAIKNLNPGECQEVKLYVSDNIDSKECEMTIYATWGTGSAEIYKTINVNVETINIEEIIDLRKPREILIPAAPVDNEENIASFEDGLEQIEKRGELTQQGEENISQYIQQPLETEQETDAIDQETIQSAEEISDKREYGIINDIEELEQSGAVTGENGIIDKTSDPTEQDSYKDVLEGVSSVQESEDNGQQNEEKEVMDENIDNDTEENYEASDEAEEYTQE